ncbi:hypothetical protein [Sinorhizobium meliloti]|uniref:hypothetical protein n=1 Tax=Rhizobium meliloti TaxID=382 RepID=UPI000FDBEB49|nr:hypothetical protein [Sinorhizobium meliloti]RVL63361.1 hypothetical protein CN137_12410 [Sinorhizobium meliloti]
MANSPVPATAEGMSKESLELFMRAQDHVGECIDFSRLVFNAIEGMNLDNDLKALSAGVYAIEKKLQEAETLLDRARGWPLSQ